MNKITTIGLDIAKNVFHIIACDRHGKVLSKKMLRRSQLLNYVAQLEACLVGMEACASAHYWARQFTQLGHQVKLVPAQHVKGYLRGNKNDYNDALAIAEAVCRPNIRFVPVKSIEQQDIQALHRLRDQCVQTQNKTSNQIRGLAAEYGLICAQGFPALRKAIPEWLEDGENELTDLFRELLQQRYNYLLTLDQEIAYYTKQIRRYSQQNEACQRLQAIPCFGPIVATAFYSHVGNGHSFQRGRDVSASLGIVPRQHSTGGRDVLLGISKRGNRYLRRILIHGARSVVGLAKHRDDPLSQWINRIRETRGTNKAIVALANKMARVGWAVLAKNTTYQPCAHNA